MYGPELDIDLAVESIEYPEGYALVSKGRPNLGIQPACGRLTTRVKEGEIGYEANCIVGIPGRLALPGISRKGG